MKLSSLYITTCHFTLLAFTHHLPGCTTSLIKAHDKVNGSINIDLNPLTSLDNARLAELNATAHEEWYFDSISIDGKSNLVCTFFRDPSIGSPLGSTWVMLDAVWPNGTRTSNVIFVEESRIITCPDKTYGIWNSTDKNFSFSVSSDHTLATIDINGGGIRGSWTLHANTPARYISGSLVPNATETLHFAPYLWWEEPIPSGNVTSSFKIHGTPFELNGYGGHDYFADAYAPWAYICKNWIWARLIVGPFTLVVWLFTSSIDSRVYSSVFLLEGTNVRFSTLNTPAVLDFPTPSPTQQYAKVSLLYNGGIHGSFINNATGFAFDLVEAGASGRSWHFETKHMAIGLESPISSNQQFTRFLDTAIGGERGKQNFTGAGNSEQTFIVKSMPLPMGA
jgi:hypothetical protein